MYWVYFITLIAVMYVSISFFAQFTGDDSAGPVESLKRLLTPTALGLLIVTNVLFVVGIYFGFLVSANAIPISIAVGIIVSYIYSVLVLAVPLSLLHVIGIVLIMAGIYLLR